ncbi:type I-E CRISPR-associated protein Cse2/CasB [Celeribacter sp.]|uniref:type I-E CRISPR-associated protein Cse2/CasB n=1 Tax=Celeribacter sp. TaxID=1890673 RepID=UPI003A92A2AE
MSEEKQTTGSMVLGWWSQNIGNREAAHARALSARLRRAETVDVLGERAVIELAGRLGIGANSARLPHFITMVRLLAELRTHEGTSLARHIGGADPVLSELRFQRLLRSEGEEFEDLMRRAILMADRKCNVAAFGGDVLYWGEAVRQRWCFQYFGAEASSETSREIVE